MERAGLQARAAEQDAALDRADHQLLNARAEADDAKGKAAQVLEAAVNKREGEEYL